MKPTCQERPPVGSELHMPPSSPSDTCSHIVISTTIAINTMPILIYIILTIATIATIAMSILIYIILTILTILTNITITIILPFSLHGRYIEDKVSTIDTGAWCIKELGNSC